MEGTATGTKKASNHPFPWLNALVTEPYYLLHFLYFFSYVVARTSAAQFLSYDSSLRVLRQEIQAFLAFCVLAIVKVVKEETWESFIADTLLFAKVFLIAVSLILDYHLTIYYMIGFLVIYISTQQPAFEGLGNAHHMTPLQLETLLTEGNTSRFWLVEFRASCSLASVRTSRVLPDLSNMYSNKNMSFGIVDIGHFPNAAEKFGISLGVNMAPLPTYILFKNATEVARLPKVDFEAKSSSPNITKSLLCRYFELDLHLLEYVSGK